MNRDYERRRDLLLLHADSPPPWTPAALGAIVEAWWEADSGITLNGGTVSGWVDKVKGRELAQALAGNQPAYNATGSPSGGPIVVFDGAASSLKTVGFTLNQPNYVAIAMRFTKALADSYVCDGNAINSGAFYSNGSRMYAWAGGGGASIALPAVAWRVWEKVQNGANSWVQCTGVARGTGNGGAANMGGFTLGSTANKTLFATADVTSVVICSAEPSAAQLAQLQAYMRAKGGF